MILEFIDLKLKKDEYFVILRRSRRTAISLNFEIFRCARDDKDRKRGIIMGKRGPKPGKAYGAAAIARVFKNISFPLSKNDIMEKYGTREIEFTKGSPVQVRQILWDIQDETFNSPADLEHALHEELMK
jgi:hypothetical protein